MLVMLKMSVPPLLFLCRWIMWHQNIVWTSYRSLKCQKKTRSKMFLGLKVEVLFSEWAFPCHAAVSGSALMVFCEAFAVPWSAVGVWERFVSQGGDVSGCGEAAALSHPSQPCSAVGLDARGLGIYCSLSQTALCRAVYLQPAPSEGMTAKCSFCLALGIWDPAQPILLWFCEIKYR